MSLLEIEQCRALVDTPLNDVRLLEIIDREEQYITDKIGAPYSSGVTISETLQGGHRSIFTKRRIGSITSVTEFDLLSSTTGTALVDGTTFFAWPERGTIQRLGLGTFGERVDVVYTPKDENSKRRQVIVDLVRLTIARPALASEEIASEYSYDALDNYEAERQRIVRRLMLNRF